MSIDANEVSLKHYHRLGGFSSCPLSVLYMVPHVIIPASKFTHYSQGSRRKIVCQPDMTQFCRRYTAVTKGYGTVTVDCFWPQS